MTMRRAGTRGRALRLSAVATVAAALAVPVLAQGKKDDKKKKEKLLPHWGEKGYWVKLKDILSTEGDLEPAFNEHYPGPYTLTVYNSEVTAITIKPVINHEK